MAGGDAARGRAKKEKRVSLSDTVETRTVTREQSAPPVPMKPGRISFNHLRNSVGNANGTSGNGLPTSGTDNEDMRNIQNEDNIDHAEHAEKVMARVNQLQHQLSKQQATIGNGDALLEDNDAHELLQ